MEYVRSKRRNTHEYEMPEVPGAHPKPELNGSDKPCWAITCCDAFWFVHDLVGCLCGVEKKMLRETWCMEKMGVMSRRWLRSLLHACVVWLCGYLMVTATARRFHFLLHEKFRWHLQVELDVNLICEADGIDSSSQPFLVIETPCALWYKQITRKKVRHHVVLMLQCLKTDVCYCILSGASHLARNR